MSIVPATIIWNHGSPGEVFTSASIHAPSVTTSEAERCEVTVLEGASAGSVSSVSDGGRAATCITASWEVEWR